MSTIKSFIGFGILLIITPVITGHSSQVMTEASSDNVLERQVPKLNPEPLTTPEAFLASLGFTGVPGGVVKITSCNGEQEKRTWRLQNSTLRNVLNSIILEDPRYDWAFEKGVVNLLPSTGEPPLLRTRINEFQVTNITSANAALGQLLALPEMKKAMADLNLKPGLWLFAEPQSLHPRSFNVYFKDVTLREGLNAIARAEGSEVWDYVEIHCDGKNEVVIRF